MRATGVLGQQAPAGGGGTIAYVGQGTFTSGAPLTTLSLAIDPGHSTGDLLIAVVCVDNDQAITGPADWTELQQLGGTAGIDNQAGVWYKFADGTEGATEDWTTGAATEMWGVCLAYSGVASVADTSANDVRGTSETYTGTLPTVANGDWLVFYIAPGFVGRSFTEPASATEIYDTAGATSYSLAIAHQGPLSGAPSIETWTPSAATTATSGPVLLKV